MDIRLQFSLTPDDYVDFQRAYVKHRRVLTPAGHRGLRSPMNVVWAVLGALTVGMCVVSNLFVQAPAAAPTPPPPSMLEALLALLPYGLLFFVLWGFLLWVMRSRLVYGRLAAHVMHTDQPRVVEIRDEGLVLRQAGLVSEMQWGYFMRVIETRSSFLLFILPRSAEIVPKRAFGSAGEMEEFRGFTMAHVGNVPVGFPVQGVGKSPEGPATYK